VFQKLLAIAVCGKLFPNSMAQTPRISVLTIFGIDGDHFYSYIANLACGPKLLLLVFRRECLVWEFAPHFI